MDYSKIKQHAISLTLGLVAGAATQDHINVFFSPNGGVTREYIRQIDHAESSIYVQQYTFTSQLIADALVNAKKRGVDVQIILDDGQIKANNSYWKLMRDNQIPTLFDYQHAIAHNKVTIIDEHIVLGGSFNLSHNAETNNAENMTVIDSKDVAKEFLDNYNNHHRHSRP